MVEKHISNFISYLSFQKRASPLTVKSYQLDLIQFFNFLESEIKLTSLNQITHQHARGFIAHLMDKGISARSVNRKLSSLKSFFNYLLKQNSVASNPITKVQGPKAIKNLPVFVDEKQTEYLFEKYIFEDTFIGKRNKLIIDIFYQTGVRRAELLNIKESDVDIYNSQIKVLGKRNKERIIPFDISLKRNLEAYIFVKKELKLKNPYLLVSQKDTQLNAQAITKIVNEVLSAVTTSKNKSPHVLRHTFATHLLNNGANINAVKELLGHASLQATQIYTHNTIEKLKKQYNQAHPRSGD